MKLRIIEAGWKGYTGDIGGVEFVDGVSVDDMTPFISNRIQAAIGCVNADTGVDEGVTALLLQGRDIEMAENLPPANTTQLNEQTALTAADEESRYTQAELETIASARGIEGLREIADQFNISAKSIVTLIPLMLKAGLRHPKKPEVMGGDDTTRNHDPHPVSVQLVK